MAIKTINDLSSDAKGYYKKAASAIEINNYGYAIQLLLEVLKEMPECLDARKQLRRAEVQFTKGKRSFLGGLSSVGMKGGSAVKKDPVAAMLMAEKALEGAPYSVAANHLLKDAALAAGLPEIAAFALETLVEASPRDTKALADLASHHYDRGDYEKALNLFNRIVEINPADLIAAKRGKDAAARLSMIRTGWEEATDFRTMIKDKDAAVAREQESRVFKDAETIDRQIGDLYERAEAEPENVDVARKIAGLFEMKEEWESAVWWYDRAAQLTNYTDQTLVRKSVDLHLKIYDHELAIRKGFLVAQPDHEDAPRLQAEIEDLTHQRAELMVGEARRRVERNPTDLMFRFELGDYLLTAGHPTEAIPELQKARNNPSIRVKALYLLGKCYQAKGMLDFAERHFSEAANELSSMDAMKKEIVYRLGLLYEGAGKADRALDCFKQIYEVDYEYEDVARRVESAYEQPPA
jgi:tetratricopeptide (TPR) repeat protein